MKVAALETLYYGNQRVEAVGDFSYDALYRLVEGRGREHIGQMALSLTPANVVYRDYPFVGSRRYTLDEILDAIQIDHWSG